MLSKTVAFTFAIMMVVAGCQAQDEQEDRVPVKKADATTAATNSSNPWKRLRNRRWHDRSASAGASYEFFDDDEGRPRAKHTVFGSGVPVVAEEVVDVEIREGVISVGSAAPAQQGGARTRNFRYEPRADILRQVDGCGLRLVPYGEAGYPVESPLLARLGIGREDVVEQALSNPDPLVRREAIVVHTFHQQGTYRAGFPEVVKLMKDANAEIRAYAAWSAGQCQEEAAVPLLLRNLTSEDPDLRRESAGALGWGSLGGQGAVQPLRDLLERETNPRVRAYAERSLKILTRKK